MKFTLLPQFNRDAKRFKEIVQVLLKYGLANWIKETNPEFIKGMFKGPDGQHLSEYSFETRIRLAITELGPTFIKLGQILSTRADMVGPTLAEELAILQSQTPADPPEAVRKIILEELGQTPEKLFAQFNETAVASASIGQIHEAILHSGHKVVVKVQHLGIEEKIETDLDILTALAEFAEKVDPNLRLYRPRETLGEFRRVLLRELDFQREARNLERFRINFAVDANARMPRAFPDLSSRKVLTMDMLEGFSIADRDRLHGAGVDPKVLANRGAHIFLEMIFRDNFYHADPHPGNIWVLEDGVLGLLDYGMVGRLDEQTRHAVEGMLLAVVERDTGSLTDQVIRLCSVPSDLDRRVLQADISDFVDEYLGHSIQDLNLSEALNSLTRIIRHHRLILPSSISLLIRVIVVLEGTSRQLNPDFSLVELLEPYYKHIVEKRFSPDYLFTKFKRSARDWNRLMEMLPGELSDLLQRMRLGRLNILFEHHRLDTVVNRLIYGILTAAVFMGSCQLLSRQVPPTIWGLSLLGLVGVFTAFVFGLRLLRAIGKSGGLRRRN
jgi:ubiquinone biosynthesis protein